MPSKRAKRLKKKRAQLPQAKAAAVTGEQAAEERRGLSIFLRQTTAFRLALALYNDPVARDEAIRSLREELAGQGTRVLTLDLREPSEERTLLARVEATVKGANLPPDGRLAVMVVNLEGQVDYTPELAEPGGPGTEFLQTANLHRELFPDICPGPLVIWMTELLERAIVSHAPDFWHWRSHVFDLRTRIVPPKTLVAAKVNAWSNDDYRRHPKDRLQHLEEELAAYRKADNLLEEGRVLNAIGVARMDMGDSINALIDFRKAKSIFGDLKRLDGEGMALNNLGLAYNDLGDHRKAVKCFTCALSVARETANRYLEGMALGGLGLAYAGDGKTRTAIENYQLALIIIQETGNRRGEGSVLGNLGNAYRQLGDVRQAVRLYKQQLAITREINHRLGEGNALGSLATTYLISGDVRQAAQLYKQQLAITREVGDLYGESVGLWNSALCYVELNDYMEAIKLAERALSIKETICDPQISKIKKHVAEWRETAKAISGS